MSSRFRSGGEAAQVDSTPIGGGGGSFRRTAYLPKIKPGERLALRYLDEQEDWLYADAHPSAPTKAKPDDWPKESNWPDSMPAVCRHDKAFQADPKNGIEALYNDCYICDSGLTNAWGRTCKPVVRVWARAVLREEVVGTQAMADSGAIPANRVGKRVGYRDVKRTVNVPKRDDKGESIKDADGKTVLEEREEIAIVVVNQAVSNYFAGLIAMASQYETIRDRDFVVTRTGEGKDTEYTHIPMDPVPGLAPGEDSWKRYEDAIKDQGDSVDLDAIMTDRSSDDYYARFFDPSKTPTPRGGSKEGAQSGASEAPVAQQEAASSNEPDADKLAQMRARMKSAGGAEPAEPVAAASGQVDFG